MYKWPVLCTFTIVIYKNTIAYLKMNYSYNGSTNILQLCDKKRKIATSVISASVSYVLPFWVNSCDLAVRAGLDYSGQLYWSATIRKHNKNSITITSF